LITAPQPFEFIRVPGRGRFDRDDDLDDDDLPKVNLGRRWKAFR